MTSRSWLHSALPDETFKVELEGWIGSSWWWELFLPSAPTKREISLGITGSDLVVVDPPTIHNPPQVRRVPLSRVKLVSSTEGLVEDQLVLEIGEPRPFRVRVHASQRERTKEFLRILSGDRS